VTVQELCDVHARVGLDSSLFVYLFETGGQLADVAAEVVDCIEAGATRGAVSTLLISEVTGGPARSGDLELMERYAYEIGGVSNLAVLPVDEAIAFAAAVLRGSERITLTDAVHLATARAAGASAFVTNDRRLRSRPGLDVIYLGDLEPSEP
jgi:predicted nucleic acid-binding protein